jgi:hypothetical protein
MDCAFANLNAIQLLQKCLSQFPVLEKIVALSRLASLRKA